MQLARGAVTITRSQSLFDCSQHRGHLIANRLPFHLLPKFPFFVFFFSPPSSRPNGWKRASSTLCAVPCELSGSPSRKQEGTRDRFLAGNEHVWLFRRQGISVFESVYLWDDEDLEESVEMWRTWWKIICWSFLPFCKIVDFASVFEEVIGVLGVFFHSFKWNENV